MLSVKKYTARDLDENIYCNNLCYAEYMKLYPIKMSCTRLQV